jgi:hypothetical protein
MCAFKDHKHDALLAEMSALEQKSAMLQALLVGDLSDLKKSDLELQQAIASVRYAASRKCGVLLAAAVSVIEVIFSPYVCVRIRAFKGLARCTRVTPASSHACSGDVLMLPAYHACGCASPFRARVWSIPYAENIWRQLFRYYMPLMRIATGIAALFGTQYEEYVTSSLTRIIIITVVFGFVPMCRLRAVDELLSVRRSNVAWLARAHEEGMATLSLFEIQQSQERSGDAAARTSNLQERSKLLEARAEAIRSQIDDTKCEINEAYASLLHGSSDDRQRAAKHSAKTALEKLWDARGVPIHARSEFMLRVIKRAPFSIALRVMFESELAKLAAAIAEATTTEHTRRLRGFIARLETTVSSCVGFFYCRVPKFSPYGSVCCACAQRPGLPRQSFSRTLMSQKP